MTGSKNSKIAWKALTQRDVIRAGDQYRTNWGEWTEIPPEFVGKRKGAVFSWTLRMRREVK